MRSFNLTPDLVTGIRAIDEQHGELLDLANEVVDMPEGHLHPELFELALTFLVGYTAYHFAAEEVVMTDLDYPQRGQHFDHHRQLQQSVGNLAAEARIKGATPACQTEIARFLNDWIVHHIRESDREMAQFLVTQPIDLEALILPDIRTLKLCGAIPIDFDEKFATGTAGVRQR